MMHVSAAVWLGLGPGLGLGVGLGLGLGLGFGCRILTRLIPRPPARVERRKTNVSEPGRQNRSIAAWAGLGLGLSGSGSGSGSG